MILTFIVLAALCVCNLFAAANRIDSGKYGQALARFCLFLISLLGILVLALEQLLKK